MRPRIPLIHITDLYHPPQDPDDDVDLLTVVALDAYDLRAVILDITEKFLEPAPAGRDIRRDPGLIPVAQIGYLTGRTIPVACGPVHPLRDMHDDLSDRPPREQAAIELILQVLADCPEPVLISVVGSARTLTAAFNRAPDLVAAKTRAVLLSSGSISAAHIEWNVQLDPAAYEGLWRSGLPIQWFPCTTETGPFNAEHERGTFWGAAHKDLFKGLPAPLLAWIYYAFSGSSRGDFIHALREPAAGAVWEHVLAGRRNMWSTAALAMGCGRVLARTAEGWRFLPADQATDTPVYPWYLDSIRVSGISQQKIDWQVSDGAEKHGLFRRQPGAAFGEAMAEALNALLQTIKVT